MNKRSTRWISLVLSFAVMLGSIVYIAAGVNAETTLNGKPNPNYLLSDSDRVSSGKVTSDVASTNIDELKGGTAAADGSRTYTYSKVLDGAELVEKNTDVDVYFDIFSSDGRTSVTAGDTVKVVVTMENSTADQFAGTAAEYSTTKNTTKYNSADIDAFSFDLSYNGVYLKPVSMTCNVPEVTFADNSSTARIKVSCDSKIYSYEMLYFYFEFKAEAATSAETAKVSIPKDSITITPAKLTFAAAEPVEYTVYASGANNALTALTGTYTCSEGTKELLFEPEFSPEVTEYFVTVPKDTTEFLFSETLAASDSKAVVTNDWDATSNFGSGIHYITISVTSKNGTVKDYTVVVKKLATDTLADPKTVLSKTVTYNEDGIKYTEGGTEYTASAKVDYNINGINSLLAPGNGYVIRFDDTDVNAAADAYEYIAANTANLDDSSVVFVVSRTQPSGSDAYLTYDGIGDPEKLVDIKNDLSALAAGTGNAVPTGESAESLLNSTGTDKGNKYLFDISGTVSGSDAVTEVCSFPGSSGGSYERITVPAANVDAALAAKGRIIDNTAAEFVFIVDYSSGNVTFNEAETLALFGYDGTKNAGDSGIPGYIEQMRRMLANDSTAKITLIAVGASGTGKTGDDVLDTGHSDYGIRITSPSDTGVEAGSVAHAVGNNNVYQTRTYILPYANTNIWGSTSAETAVNNEQDNLFQYARSFSEREKTGGTSSGKYTSTVPANDTTSPSLSEEYAVAVNAANGLLADAYNPQLIIITPNSKSTVDSLIHTGSAGSASSPVTVVNAAVAQGIDTTVLSGVDDKSTTNQYNTAKKLYNSLIMDSKNAFISNPGGNERSMTLTDNLNSQIFWVQNSSASQEAISYQTLPIDRGDYLPKYEATWYLPSLGKYSLEGGYYAVRHSDSDSKLLEDRYYPLSDTVDTKDRDSAVILDDIPSVSVTYDDVYALDVTKGVSAFADRDKVRADASTIAYVVTFTNSGQQNLSDLEIADTQIMAAKSPTVYKLPAGQTEPKTTDTAMDVTFRSATTGSAKGVVTIPGTLKPGESYYITYVIVVPQSSSVTTGTSSTNASDNTKIDRSYTIDNVATGKAKEINDTARVDVSTEFKYDTSSNGSSSNTDPTPPDETTIPTTKSVGPENPTGESSVGYIIAVSLLFGALGVFGVTIYGIVLDRRIEEAKSAKYFRRRV